MDGYTQSLKWYDVCLHLKVAKGLDLDSQQPAGKWGLQ